MNVEGGGILVRLQAAQLAAVARRVHALNALENRRRVGGRGGLHGGAVTVGGRLVQPAELVARVGDLRASGVDQDLDGTQTLEKQPQTPAAGHHPLIWPIGVLEVEDVGAVRPADPRWQVDIGEVLLQAIAAGGGAVLRDAMVEVGQVELEIQAGNVSILETRETQPTVGCCKHSTSSSRSPQPTLSIWLTPQRIEQERHLLMGRGWA